MIKTFLTNSTKYRDAGIDIRSEGGYIVGPPSVRDGREYLITNVIKPIDLPVSLLNWLLVGKSAPATPKESPRQITTKTTHVTTPTTFISEYHYDLTDEN